MKVVLVGLGMVANTHIEAIKDAKDVTLVGVLGRSDTKTEVFATMASSKLGYAVDALQHLEQASDVDFAIIATPPDARFEHVRFLAAQKTPMLMEKPLERSFDAALNIVEICEAADVATGVYFQNRTRKAARAMYDAVRHGHLGDILMAEIRVPWWRDQSYYDEPGRGTYARDGGGVLINQAIHTLDLAGWILGPWKDVQAKLHKTVLHRMEAEDWAAAVFETQSGTVGTISATTAAYPGGAESISLQGTKAAAVLKEGVLRITRRDGSVDETGTSSASGGGADPMAFTHAWHQRILEDFTQCLKTGSKPLVTAREALAAHALIDAMERSSKMGERVEVAEI